MTARGAGLVLAALLVLLNSSCDTHWFDSVFGELNNPADPKAPDYIPSPGNGTAQISTDHTVLSLSWGQVEKASTYWLQISQRSDFGSPIEEKDITSTGYTVAAAPYMHTTYYWRVRPGASGQWGGWSATWTFGFYSVTYEPNGADGGATPTDTNLYQKGDYVAVQSNAGGLAKTGSVFSRWNTKADGSGTPYNPSDTFSMPGNDVSLYAEWARTYTVSYDPNGATSGAPPADNNRYKQGDSVPVLGNPDSLAKTGYEFSGWNTKADGSGTTYAAGDVFFMGNSNVVLYAKWMTTYSVTYDPNGATSGTPPIDNNRYKQGDSVPVIGNPDSLAKTGYEFSGWNTKADGSGTHYYPPGTFSMPGNDVTLYAEWTVPPVAKWDQSQWDKSTWGP